jgi:hypothetical protein
MIRDVVLLLNELSADLPSPPHQLLQAGPPLHKRFAEIGIEDFQVF